MEMKGNNEKEKKKEMKKELEERRKKQVKKQRRALDKLSSVFLLACLILPLSS
jgi:hypothetical protein